MSVKYFPNQVNQYFSNLNYTNIPILFHSNLQIPMTEM